MSCPKNSLRLYAYLLAGDLPHGTVVEWPGMLTSLTWSGANGLRLSRKKAPADPKDDAVAILRVEVRPGASTCRVMGRVNGPDDWMNLLGNVYRGHDGKLYRADHFDYYTGPCGFRMVEVDNDGEDVPDGRIADVSERAIDRTYHRRYLPHELLSLSELADLLFAAPAPAPASGPAQSESSSSASSSSSSSPSSPSGKKTA